MRNIVMYILCILCNKMHYCIILCTGKHVVDSLFTLSNVWFIIFALTVSPNANNALCLHYIIIIYVFYLFIKYREKNNKTSKYTYACVIVICHRKTMYQIL